MPRGNPNWLKGVSGNPNGQPMRKEAFKRVCIHAVTEFVIEAWVDELQERERVICPKNGDPYKAKARGQHWVECSKMLAAYGYGKPSQSVEVVGDPERPIVARELTDEELMRIAAQGMESDKK